MKKAPGGIPPGAFFASAVSAVQFRPRLAALNFAHAKLAFTETHAVSYADMAFWLRPRLAALNFAHAKLAFTETHVLSYADDVRFQQSACAGRSA